MCIRYVTEPIDKLAVFKIFAWHNAALEGQELCKDQWQLLSDEAYRIYKHGQNRKPVTVFEFLMWHKSILPYGGFFRQCDPIVMEAGESFDPLPPKKIFPFVNETLLPDYNSLIDGCDCDPYEALAYLHFEQWQAHPWPDGNKRHCRKMTLLACGYLDLDPVVVRLCNKTVYFNALSSGDIGYLADVLKSCTLEYGEDLC